VLDYRDRLRADMLRFHRRSDGTVDPARLDEIDEYVAAVGAGEADYLRRHGIDVPVTQQPGENAGNVPAIPLPNAEEPTPSLDEIAHAWLRDWDGATAEQRSEMASQNLSPELKARIKELRGVRA
jgi:hypothetical protein